MITILENTLSLRPEHKLYEFDSSIFVLGTIENNNILTTNDGTSTIGASGDQGKVIVEVGIVRFVDINHPGAIDDHTVNTCAGTGISACIRVG